MCCPRASAPPASDRGSQIRSRRTSSLRMRLRISPSCLRASLWAMSRSALSYGERGFVKRGWLVCWERRVCVWAGGMYHLVSKQTTPPSRARRRAPPAARRSSRHSHGSRRGRPAAAHPLLVLLRCLDLRLRALQQITKPVGLQRPQPAGRAGGGEGRGRGCAAGPAGSSQRSRAAAPSMPPRAPPPARRGRP